MRVGTIYRRTRPVKVAGKTQRAEVHFDEISGCLRTPAGGSSRQTVLIVEGKKVRSRLLSPREAARLMGASLYMPLLAAWAELELDVFRSVRALLRRPSAEARSTNRLRRLVNGYANPNSVLNKRIPKTAD
jgi:hypothetical protein